MKTKLAVRPVKVRLQLAYLAHAIHNFNDCETGCTTDRWVWFPDNIAVQYDGPNFSGPVHPYAYVWLRTGELYDDMFSHMSDQEIDQRYSAALRLGFEYDGEQIPASRVIQATSDWDKRGWTRYECKRNSRRSAAWKVAPWGVSLTVACLTGIFINPEGA